MDIEKRKEFLRNETLDMSKSEEYRIKCIDELKRICQNGERPANIQFQKSGSGSINARINLPIGWVRELKISEEDRSVNIRLEGNKIIIEKA